MLANIDANVDRYMPKIETSNFAYPRILHQIWLSDNNRQPPPSWEAAAARWKDLHPDWLYIRWTNTLVNELLAHYPSYQNIYASLPYLIQRVDMARYLFLHRYGGVYTDMDTIPQRPLTQTILTNTPIALVASANLPLVFCNGFMVSQRGSSFWLRVLERVIAPRPWWAISQFFEVMRTGGLALTSAALNASEAITRLPTKLFNPQTSRDARLGTTSADPNAAITLLPGESWHSWDTRVLVWISEHWVWILIIIVILIIIWLLWRRQRKVHS